VSRKGPWVQIPPPPLMTSHLEVYDLGRVSDDLSAMRMALEEAAKAEEAGEVPVGAVAVLAGQVLARRHNEREALRDPTAHAEMLAIRDAASRIGSWRLEGLSMFVTLEPCAMCAGALVAARVQRLVFAAPDPKAGAAGSLYNLCADPRLNHEIEVVPGVLEREAAWMLSGFFERLRQQGRAAWQGETLDPA
jgi:tRNA(adenine34) deaminase